MIRLLRNKKSLSPRGERLVLRGATLFGLTTIFAGTALRLYPGLANAALAPEPTQFANLSVRGSRVHSNSAQVSAHTLPDSLNLASSCTTPVPRLCRIQL